MQSRSKTLMGAGLFIVLPLCGLMMAGCNKSDSGPDSGPPPGGRMDGPGGEMSRGGGPPRGGKGGGGGAPLAADASGEAVYKAKCGCHGPDGKNGRAPMLTGVSKDADADLTKTIHDGKGKMPSFGSQLSEEQIKKVVAYIKTFK